MNDTDPPPPEVVLFTKPQCPLCDEAREEMENAREAVSFLIREVNIYTDPELFEKYRHDIPVAVCRGVELFRHRTESSRFAECLKGLIGWGGK